MSRATAYLSGLAATVALLGACGGTQGGVTASSPASQPPVSAQPGARVSASAAASSSASATSADWQAEWDRTVAAAKQEGRIALQTAPGEPYRKLYEPFTAKYGIQVDITVGNGQADSIPRIANERKSGQYLWDVMVHSPQALFNGLKPMGAVEPLRSAIILPEILDDSKWAGGFDAGWADTDKTLVYIFVQYAEWAQWINRDIIPEAQLNKYDQLWDPKWAGKMAWQDPRVPSTAVAKAAAILKYKGEDKLRTFFTQQAPVITQDRRQLAEWVLRGQYPIAAGIEQVQFLPFAQQGLKINVQPLRDPDPVAATRAAGTGSVVLFNRPPHPNAAKVLINWLLSHEGQAAYAQTTQFNVRRLDVPVVDEDTAVNPSRDYLDVSREEAYGLYYTKALNIAKELLK